MTLWSLTDHRYVTWRLGRKVFGYDGEMQVSPSGLLVGECRGPNTDGRTPLFPYPCFSAAGRLMQYAQMTPSDYLGRLERVNQCADEWSEEEAAVRLRQILSWLMTQSPTPRVLLLGRRVHRTWSVSSPANFGSEIWMSDGLALQIAWIAHPSGLSRVYNDPDTRVKAGRMVRWCAGMEESL